MNRRRELRRDLCWLIAVIVGGPLCVWIGFALEAWLR